MAVGTERNPWRREALAFVRGLGGAYLFGIPLLYTMEMWWIGTLAGLGQLLLLLAMTFALNLVLAYFSGFKHNRTFIGDVEEAIDAVAIGAVASTVMLLVLNRISPGDPLAASLGKIVVQTVPLSLGASIANTLFSPPNHDSEDSERPAAPNPWHALVNDVGATLAGGVFIGFSIAPTDEVGLLAAGLDFTHALALMLFTALLSYAIVFTSVAAQEPAHGQGLPFQHPLAETALAYALSLAVALLILLLLGRLSLGDPLPGVLRQVLVLGLPVSVGGAAGRVII
jgi:putative integral membrane protein (TIGR02587 family)